MQRTTSPPTLRTRLRSIARALTTFVAATCALAFGASAHAATWTPLTIPPPANLDTCLLLNNGDVMCHQYQGSVWNRLTPDAMGSYKNGTWNKTTIPPMPRGNDPSFGCAGCFYQPVFFSSAVLPDGKVVIVGGEFNGTSNAQVETNIGFMYDPLLNTWSPQLQMPAGGFAGGNFGDAMSVVLQNGVFVVGPENSRNMGALNPSTGILTALSPAGKADINSEENWSMLYDGSIFTIDANIVSQFERYTPGTNTWGNAGPTPVNLPNFAPGIITGTTEVGPCVLRPDNNLFCFSGNFTGQNALYNPATNNWSRTGLMDFPAASSEINHFSMADGAAVALPNGNILAMASPVSPTQPFNTGSHFYELDFLTNTLARVTDSPNAGKFKSYQGRMLMLPTGEVLLTAYDQTATQDVMLYSNGGTPLAAWRPTITLATTSLVPGASYSIQGTLFNGFSEGASYGDDAQSATNYPLVRITAFGTGHVFYARTFSHSRMGVERVGSTELVTTEFTVPTNMDLGTASIEVVANGIASTTKIVTVAKLNTTAMWLGATGMP